MIAPEIFKRRSTSRSVCGAGPLGAAGAVGGEGAGQAVS